MVTTKLNLSMTEPSVRQIYAKQGDTGRVLDISLDQTPEDGTLRILRPDGVEVTSEAVTGGEISESGETVTFESMTEADVTELTADIEPIQDLNGYDKPWVGGAGKNKLNYDAWKTIDVIRGTAVWENNGVTLTATGDDCYTNYGVTFPSDAKIEVSEGETITLAWDATPTNVGIVIIFPNAQTSGMVVAASNTGLLSYTVASGVTYLTFRFGVANSGVTVSYKNIQVVRGTTVPAWQPYSNICPITGHDEVTVTRTGKNLLPNIRTGSLTRSGITYTVNDDKSITVKGTATSLSYFEINTTSLNTYSETLFKAGVPIYTNVEGVLPIRYTDGTYGSIQSGVSYSPPKDIGLVYLVYASGTTVDKTVYPMVTYASETDDSYEAYQGSAYTTSFGQTVYGGTLDMVSGTLTLTHALGVLDGTGNLGYIDSQSGGSYTTAYVQTTDFDSVIDKTASGISNMFEVRNASMWGTDVVALQIANAASSVRLRIPKSLLATEDVGGARAWLTANPVQIYYKLATPVTYTLTPQQIKTLLGTNNVWASSGDIVNIKFAYGGMLSELPSEATEIVGKCYCDVEQNGVSSMPFTLNIKKNERQ